MYVANSNGLLEFDVQAGIFTLPRRNAKARAMRIGMTDGFISRWNQVVQLFLSKRGWAGFGLYMPLDNLPRIQIVGVIWNILYG